MKVKKKINNNVALCLDSKGKEVIVFGKGVGFENNGMEIPLSKIDRTFYNLEQHYVDLISNISIDIYVVSEKIINYASSKLLCEINSNLLFNMADHINFAIERYNKGITFKLPVMNDVENLFEAEIDIGYYALKIIKEDLGYELPNEEAALIALNILTSEYNPMKKTIEINEKIISEITAIIENCFSINIDRKSFNYSRFTTHMFYLFKREQNVSNQNFKNKVLFKQMIDNYPATYKCVLEITDYLKKIKGWSLSEEECLYLMLHINRLCDTQIVR